MVRTRTRGGVRRRRRAGGWPRARRGPACGCPSGRRRGAVRARGPTACAAVAGLADDLDVGLGLEDHAEAGADQRWSSASSTRMSCAASLEREASPHQEAAAGCGGRRRARRRRGPPARASRPVRALAARRRRWRPRCRRRRSPARGRRGAVADHHLARGRAGVLEGVGQRLLHDPVGGQVDARRQLDRGRPRRRARPAGPASRTWSTQRVEAGAGWAAGPAARASSGARRMPSSRRSSASAWRPVVSIASKASPGARRVGGQHPAAAAAPGRPSR